MVHEEADDSSGARVVPPSTAWSLANENFATVVMQMVAHLSAFPALPHAPLFMLAAPSSTNSQPLGVPVPDVLTRQQAVAPAEADGFIVGATGVGGDGGGFIILAARAAITPAAVFLLREAWATGTRRREERGEQEPYKHPAARRSAAWSCGSLDGGGGCHCSGCKTACER